jgi:hypothetical protein
MYTINITAIGDDFDKVKLILIRMLNDLEIDDSQLEFDSSNDIGVTGIVTIVNDSEQDLRKCIGLS